MFLEYKIYKHRNCRDVAFYPVVIHEVGEGFELTGYWVNVYFKPSQIIGADDGMVTVLIKPEQVEYWEIYEEED